MVKSFSYLNLILLNNCLSILKIKKYILKIIIKININLLDKRKINLSDYYK